MISNNVIRRGKRFFAPTVSTAFLALAFLAILGCSGVFPGSGDDMPCIRCLSEEGPPDPYDPWNRVSSSSQDDNSSSSSRQSGTIPGVSVSHGGETYETVVIGTQTWFKRNLNYNPSTGTSVCYDNESSNCSTYGRLYDWSTAMGLASSCNSTSCPGQVSTKHRGICPSGWHIPSNEDWDNLMRYADGTSGTDSPYDSYTAGKYLKAVNGWNSYSGIVNLDSYGFPPFRAATAIPAAISTVPAAAATGGVARRAMAATLTTGACTTATRTRAGTTTVRATCIVFVASRTKAKPLSEPRYPRLEDFPDLQILLHKGDRKGRPYVCPIMTCGCAVMCAKFPFIHKGVAVA